MNHNETEIVNSKPKYMVSSLEKVDEVPEWLVMAYKNAEAIQRVRELHKPGRKKDYEILKSNGEIVIESVTVCSWCQYLIDNDYYSERVAPYPCPTINSLESDE